MNPELLRAHVEHRQAQLRSEAAEVREAREAARRPAEPPCSWCEPARRAAAEERASHGICPDCQERVLAQIGPG